MLARLAAGAHNSQSGDDEAAIEKYLRSVLSLENILTLDRLRQVDGADVRATDVLFLILTCWKCSQEVAVKEQLTSRGRSNRRSLSSPSVHRVTKQRQQHVQHARSILTLSNRSLCLHSAVWK